MWSFSKGDVVEIGEPPVTTQYVILEEPVGSYARVADDKGNEHIVYMGRWFKLAEV